jgi:hypothetical protein
VSSRTQDVLRLEPHMIPALRAEFDSALSQLGQALIDLGNRGYLPAAWLGDEVSVAVAAHYTRRAMDEPDSSYRALVEYEAELTRVRDTLQRMEDHYRRTDQAVADPLRRA